MDELRCKSRSARRIAIAAAICCTASTVLADSPQGTSSQSQAFRQLIANGWSDADRPVSDKSPTEDDLREVFHRNAAEDSGASLASEPLKAETDIGSQATVGGQGNPAATIAQKIAEATILRPRQPVLEQRTTTVVEPPSSPNSIADNAVAKPHEAQSPGSLAHIIRLRTQPHVVPRQENASESFDDSRFPTVTRMSPGESVSKSETPNASGFAGSVKAAKPIEAQVAKVMPAEPIATLHAEVPNRKQSSEDRLSEGNSSEREPARSLALAELIQRQVPRAVSNPVVASEAVRLQTEAMSALPESRQRDTVDPTEPIADSQPSALGILASTPKPEDSGPSSIAQQDVPSERGSASELASASELGRGSELGSAEVAASESGGSDTSRLVDRDASIQTPNTRLAKQVPHEEKGVDEKGVDESVPMTAMSRRIARDDGFELLPLDAFASASLMGAEVLRPTMTVHATRMRELARESLRSANHRLQHRATHSAKKFAMEALQSIVAMRDAQNGGNAHSKQLARAFNAIRESKDFGRRSVVDSATLQRLVDVHETNVLKHVDVDNISALEAMQSYLHVARDNLVGAAGDVREASDALVLLGKIEKQLAPRGDTHGSAVAVVLQQSAVEVAPENDYGYRELGSTLLQQGFVQQAAWALNRSVEIRPTRAAFQGLLEASRRMGDVDGARQCVAALGSGALNSEVPVTVLAPSAFASTHRPSPADRPSPVDQPSPVDRNQITERAKSVDPKPQPTSDTKISLRSLFPFRRR